MESGKEDFCMPVFRVQKTKDFTVMSNHHLKNKALSLRSKGLLSFMLSLPEDWDYSLKGLAISNKEGIDAIRSSINELEAFGYIERSRVRNEKGQLGENEYIIHEIPISPEPKQTEPILENPTLDNPVQAEPEQDRSTQLNTNKSNTETSNTDLLNTYPINSNEPVEDSSEPTTEPIKPKQPERIGMDKILAYRQLVKQNIEYDILCEKLNGNIGMLNEIVDIITETICTSREKLTVASEERNSETVKSQLLKLNSEHIEYVLDCIKNIAVM